MTFVVGRGKYARAVYPVARHSVVAPDEKVKATAADTTPNFLSPKLAAGPGITLAVLNPGGNEQVEITATAVSEDHKVSVTAADTTPGFLDAKIAAGANVTKTVLNPGANEQLELAVLSAPPTTHAPTHRPATGTDPLVTAAPSQGIGGGNAVGVADSFSRSDHDHTIRETGGPTDLTVGIIADGQAVVRSGTALIGANVAGGSFFWGAGNLATTPVTRFLQPGYQTGVAPTTGVRIPIRRAGTIRNLTMQNRVVGVGAALITFTVLKNGVATLLAFSVAATAASGSDIVDTVSVVAGDFIELRVTKAAAIGTSPTDVEVAVDFGP